MDNSISEGHTCSRGIWLAAASTVSAAKPPALDASLPSSRPSLSAAAARLDLHGGAQHLGTGQIFLRSATHECVQRCLNRPPAALKGKQPAVACNSLLMLHQMKVHSYKST